MSALKFIQIIARKKAAEQGGKGITTIANKMQAEAKAAEIAETFRAAGHPLENLDTFIKSEKDVLKYLNIIESTKKQALEQATKKSKDILKVTKKKEEPFTGFKPKVVDEATEDINLIQKSIDDLNKAEAEADAFSASLNIKQRGSHRGIGAGAQASAESSKRIKQGFSTQAKLNNWS